MPLMPMLNYKQTYNLGWKNIHYIHVAAAFWMLTTIWICKIYTPRPFSDDFLLYAIGLLGSGAFTMIFYLHIKPYPIPLSLEKDQIKNAESLFTKYGKSTMEYFKVYQDKQLFFGRKVKGFIAYKIAAGLAVVVDDPVCGDEHDHKMILIQEFEHFCKTFRLSPCYYKVDKSALSLFNKMGKKSIQIGQEAIINVQCFNIIDKNRKFLQNAVKRIEKEGLQTKLHLPPLKNGLLQQLEMVSDEWMKTMDEKGTPFSQITFNTEEMRSHRVMTVENEEGRIIAFLNIVPGNALQEVTYDLIRKTNDAPNGTLDVLIVKMIEYSKACGYEYLNMGHAPFTGMENSNKLPEKIIKMAYRKIPLFKFYHHLNDFKEKFDPQWQDQFLIYNRSYQLLLLPIAINTLLNRSFKTISQSKENL